MSNLLHFVAVDRAVEHEIFDPPSDLLLSDYCTEVVEDGFENERRTTLGAPVRCSQRGVAVVSVRN